MANPYSSPDDPCYEIVCSAERKWEGAVTGAKKSVSREADGIFAGLTKDDAERIVACVNACRGIPTEELVNRVFVHFAGTETRCYSLEDGE